MEITNEHIKNLIKVLKTNEKLEPYKPWVDTNTLKRLGVTKEEAEKFGFDVYESIFLNAVSK